MNFPLDRLYAEYEGRTIYTNSNDQQVHARQTKLDENQREKIEMQRQRIIHRKQVQ